MSTFLSLFLYKTRLAERNHNISGSSFFVENICKTNDSQLLVKFMPNKYMVGIFFLMEKSFYTLSKHIDSKHIYIQS